MRGTLGAVAVGVALIWCAAAVASSAPDAGRAFEPPPLPAPRYGIKPPSEDPARQVRTIVAADGVELVSDTWLPAPQDGNVPPDRVPVVVVLTPYAPSGSQDYNRGVELLVPRGYAVTYAHVRGTGPSGGCIEQTAQHEVDDGARFVQDAGELAPWASGAVGMLGLSYPGGTQLAVATGPDRDRLRSLKALVAGGPVAGEYEFYNHDGVPRFLHEPGAWGSYFLVASNILDSPQRLPERPGCQPEVLLDALDNSGNYTNYDEARDHSRHLNRFETPILMWHGHADRRVTPNQQLGFFDHLPATTPHKGLFGVHDHEAPDNYNFNGPLTSPRKDWERADWSAIVFAWYERWLRGVENGVEAWPEAQVQGSEGQWRTASRWPSVPGPTGRLALGPDGVLGATAPTGSTTYLEVGAPELDLDQIQHVPGTAVTFSTAPLTDRLELIGAPQLDAWVTLALPDSHVVAKLEALGPDGKRVIPEAWAAGARSAQHLDPFVESRFRQSSPKLPPVMTPIKVTLRFNPTALVVPKGGRLKLTVAGNGILWDGLDGVQEGLGPIFQGPMWPSFTLSPVTLHHSCTLRSELRFTMPEAGSQLLNVREKDEPGPLADDPVAPALSVDGGGLATRPACASGVLAVSSRLLTR